MRTGVTLRLGSVCDRVLGREMERHMLLTSEPKCNTRLSTLVAQVREVDQSRALARWFGGVQ